MENYIPKKNYYTFKEDNYEIRKEGGKFFYKKIDSNTTIEIEKSIYEELSRSAWRNQKKEKKASVQSLSLEHTYNSTDSASCSLLDFLSTDENIEDGYINKERNQYLAAAVSQLPSDERDLIYYCYVLNRTQEDCAKLLGISRGAFRCRKTKILRKLRETLHQLGYQNL